MNVLVVTAHPLNNSLCATLTQHAVDTLQQLGHDVVLEDLCTDGFDPVLTPEERANYYADTYDISQISSHTQRLSGADALVLVFPTWWFGFPAILKGWFDRVWVPGLAYDHASDFGPIAPRLHRLRHCLAITTLGAPWWVDAFVMRRPIRRILRWSLLKPCAPKARFQMLSLYRSENLPPERIKSFRSKIAARLAAWK